MKCEWLECVFETRKVDEFVEHVEQHTPQTEQRGDSGKVKIPYES